MECRRALLPKRTPRPASTQPRKRERNGGQDVSRRHAPLPGVPPCGTLGLIARCPLKPPAPKQRTQTRSETLHKSPKQMQLRNFWQRPSSHVTPCPSHGASTLTLQVGTTPSFSRTGVPLPGQRLKEGRCRGGPGRETAGAVVGPGLLPGGPAASITSSPPLRAPVLTPEPSRNQTLTFPDHLQKRMCRNHGELWRHRAERGVQTRRAPGAFHASSSHPSRPRGASPRDPGKPCPPRSWPQRQASP